MIPDRSPLSQLSWGHWSSEEAFSPFIVDKLRKSTRKQEIKQRLFRGCGSPKINLADRNLLVFVGDIRSDQGRVVRNAATQPGMV